ncbi:hypothetical protein C0991_005852 [Blastosporella zonata]|nr:hypothetical protein C0991_005852 [Blastosporella zonata]
MSFEDPEKSQSVDEKNYAVEVASTHSVPSYEEAAVTTGAPVEKISPLGYHVDSLSVIFLNISQMIGTGVFSTPGSILTAVGSVGLSLLFWVIGYVFAGASLAVYLEYASYFPHRSGAEVAYLEKALLANYLLVAGGASTSTWNVRGLAVGAMTVIVIICILSTKWSLRLSNALGFIKVATLIFIAITGLVVLGGHTRVEDPHANFRNAFAGTSSNGNGLATALVKVNFAYAGYSNAFNVLSEVRDPVRTMKRYAPLSLTVFFILYFFANIAYFAAIPKEDIKNSQQLTASLFFIAVFGNSKSVKALSALVAISSLGNILAVIIGSSRIIRECGRQGVLPYPKLWASTKPFNTPVAAYLLKWLLTVIVIIAPPAGDAFNFIVDLQSYPANVFSFLMTLGLFFVRKRRASIGAPKTEFRVWNVVLLFAIAVNIYLLVLPWVPPSAGIYGGDVSFFYATYCIVGIGMYVIPLSNTRLCSHRNMYCSLVISWLAYALWIQILPKLGNYTIRQLVEKLDDGAITNRLVKVPNSELEEWDATHDEHGEEIARKSQDSSRES